MVLLQLTPSVWVCPNAINAIALDEFTHEVRLFLDSVTLKPDISLEKLLDKLRPYINQEGDI